MCFGDSGGAALIQDNNQQWTLIGVNSFVYDPEGGDPTCEGGASAALRVDSYLLWIENQISSSTESNNDNQGNQSSGNPRPLTDEQEKSGCSHLSFYQTFSYGLFALIPFLLGRRQNPLKNSN